MRRYTGEKPALGSMISEPACDGPDGTEVDPDPLAALVPESSPLPDPPVVSILQPASVSVAVTRTVAAERAVTEASTRRGSMWGSLSGGRPGVVESRPSYTRDTKSKPVQGFRPRNRRP